jgi:hypothetical protein
MQNVFKSLLFLLSLFLFSFELSSAELKFKGEGKPVVDSRLPQSYAWYVVTTKKPATQLVQGNLRKTFQLFTEKQGVVTVVIDNYEDGSSDFYFTFNDINEPRVKIYFDKQTLTKFLNGEDPRKDYEESIKILVLNNVLYLGMLKSYFNQ